MAIPRKPYTPMAGIPDFIAGYDPPSPDHNYEIGMDMAKKGSGGFYVRMGQQMRVYPDQPEDKESSMTQPTTGLRPTRDRVLIAPYEMKDMITAGGLIIPAASRQDPHIAEVVQVGPRNVDVVPGDLVFYNRMAGSRIKEDGVRYLVVSKDDIIATVDNDVDLGGFS